MRKFFSHIYKVEATGSMLACAFGSGIIRVIAVTISAIGADIDTDYVKNDYVRLIQIVRPHRMAINAMSLNPLCKYVENSSRLGEFRLFKSLIYANSLSQLHFYIVNSFI